MPLARPLAAAALAQPACAGAPISPADATTLAQSFLASLQARDARGLAALMDEPFRQLGAVALLSGPHGTATTCATEAKHDAAKQKLAACIAQDVVFAHMLPKPIPGTWSMVKASDEAAWLKQRVGADLGSVGSDVVIARFRQGRGRRAQYFVGIGRGFSRALVVKHFAVTWIPPLS